MKRPFRGAAPEAKRIVNKQGRTGGGGRVEIAGIGLSHPGRVFYPDDGITKLELARYYEAVGARIVPHLRGRPLTLVRCPETIEERAELGWTVRTLPARLARQRRDPWAGYFACKQKLTPEMMRILRA